MYAIIQADGTIYGYKQTYQEAVRALNTDFETANVYDDTLPCVMTIRKINKSKEIKRSLWSELLELTNPDKWNENTMEFENQKRIDEIAKYFGLYEEGRKPYVFKNNPNRYVPKKTVRVTEHSGKSTVFKSIKECARQYGTTPTMISYLLNGKGGKTKHSKFYGFKVEEVV